MGNRISLYLDDDALANLQELKETGLREAQRTSELFRHLIRYEAKRMRAREADFARYLEAKLTMEPSPLPGLPPAALELRQKYGLDLALFLEHALELEVARCAARESEYLNKIKARVFGRSSAENPVDNPPETGLEPEEEA